MSNAHLMTSSTMIKTKSMQCVVDNRLGYGFKMRFMQTTSLLT